MEKILSLKHWKLFLLFLPGAWISPSPLKEIINSIAVITFIVWVYCIVIYGYKKAKTLNIYYPINIKFFKANTILLIIFYPIVFFNLNGSSNFTLLVFSLSGCYLFFGIFYASAAAGKTIASLEEKRDVHFKGYFLYFILILVAIIGVWVLQPKVNKLIS